MNFDEIVKKSFENDFENQNNLNDIISHLESFKDKVIIEETGISFDDCIKKKKNPNYQMDLKIKKTPNGIIVPYMFSSILKLIKNHTQKSISEIGIDTKYIDKIDLSKFNKLKKITCPNTYIYPENLEYISKYSNIKNIESKFSMFDYSMCDLDCIAYSNNKILYKGIQVINPSFKNEDRLCINMNSLNKEDIKEILNSYDLSLFKRISIKTKDGEVIVNLSKNKECDINVNCKDVSLVYDSYNCFKNIFKINEIKFPIENRKNEKLNYTTFDYGNLDEIAKKVKITVGYDSSYIESSSYEDFRALVDSIRWYRSIINAYPLSPLEKLTFAYDIMKTFQYNESLNDSIESRQPHKILKTGNIVCVGYTSLLNELLYGLDKNIESSNFSVTCYKDDNKTVRGYHSRSIVKIDDDKYDIHGFYALDSTWDSLKKNGKEVLGDDYDALSLYNYFLVPFTEYEKAFPHDSKPDFFDCELETLNDDLSIENINKHIKEQNNKKSEEKSDKDLNSSLDFSYKNPFSYNFPESFYKKYGVKDILKSFKSRRLSPDKFLTLIRNVRIAQGYKGKILEDEINKIERIVGYFNEKENSFERR